MPDFSVVVINYNGKEFLRRSLTCVRESGLSPLRVVVVDDASTDGSDKMARSEFPEFLLLRHEENRGPTAARNTGAREARGKYIIFLDNDVLVRENTFETLIHFMETHPEAGICGPKFKPEKGEKIWWNMGYDPNIFRATIGRLFGFLLIIFPDSKNIKNASMRFSLNYWDYDYLLEVGWVGEACNTVRRDIFDQMGGFDEQFVMFHEGPDLSRRMGKKGFKTYFNPDVEVDLLESHTHSSSKRRTLFIKSTVLFYRKHYFNLK